MAASDSRFEVKPTAGNHFAWLRTRMSIDRTLMAWVRTATALIGFGFTIVQFFERLGSMDNVAAAARPLTDRAAHFATASPTRRPDASSAIGPARCRRG